MVIVSSGLRPVAADRRAVVDGGLPLQAA